MLKDFEVLVPVPMMPSVLTALEAQFTVHKLFDVPNPEAIFADVAPRIRGVAARYGRQLDGAFIAQLPKLEIISSFGVGYDHVGADYAGAHGVVVTHTPGVLDDEVADTAMGLVLNAVRQLPQAERYLRAGHWPSANFPLTASLRGRTMGIVGLGRIGKAIAKRAEAFGLKIIYHGRRPQEDQSYLFYPTLLGLARACDILMVIVPGGGDTKHMINADVLDALGPNGILINVARGTVVDETALIKALEEKRILGAGLDVFEFEPQVPDALIAMDHVVLLPHVASASHATREAMGQLVVDNLVHFACGKGPLTPVPETPWPNTNKQAI